MKSLEEDGKMKIIIDDSKNPEKNPLLSMPKRGGITGCTQYEEAKKQNPEFYELLENIDVNSDVNTYMSYYIQSKINDIGSKVVDRISYVQVALTEIMRPAQSE